jgi:hypothetical protein
MKTALFLLLCLSAFAGDVRDLTDMANHWQPKQTWPEPKKEDTGFVLGGSNSDETLRDLKSINGIAVAELEKRMRPGAYSPGGFLGKDESLLAVLRKDNAFVVGQKKSTHREVALAMVMMQELGQKASGQFADKAVKFRFRGQEYEYSVRINEGFQKNPFSQEREVAQADDEQTTSGSGMVTVKNLSNHQSVSWSTMMPFLIQRYGMYEGEGTKYRVAPEKIFAVLTFLEKR